MPDDQDALAGVAALGLFEALLATLVDKDLLTQVEAEEVFCDTADAFRAAAREGVGPANEVVAQLFERVQAGCDTLRRS